MVPKFAGEDPFFFTMKAVAAAFDGIESIIQNWGLRGLPEISQDKSLEIRYARNSDFTDDVASDFLTRNLASNELEEMFARSLQPTLLNPT